MYYLLLIISPLLVLDSNNFVDLATEVQLERFEQQVGFHLANFSGLRVRKFNRTTWILDGDTELFVDLSDEYQFSLTWAHSSLGNNQWNDYPMKISKSPMCAFLNGPYKEYQPYFIDNTNFPRIGEERVCPFPKGRYWVRNLAPAGVWIPEALAGGYWRFTGSVSDVNDEVLIKYLLFMRIKRELD
ncbi:uncharacterized protein LOC131695395 [Topomyia yanbarensis]|uniref:uncharacterized protein LOC131695395 n=1 Tax=Topomyia yanbarensis TaxID=2498891 RepID=UPI00273B1C2F|nr:uncharacterized protein LOC131695395 [Topomyia yanbarensis]